VTPTTKSTPPPTPSFIPPSPTRRHQRTLPVRRARVEHLAAAHALRADLHAERRAGVTEGSRPASPSSRDRPSRSTTSSAPGSAPARGSVTGLARDPACHAILGEDHQRSAWPASSNLVTFASSRTFNVASNGTFGQYIPAVPFAKFIGKAADASSRSVLSLQQIAQSSRYRTNLGILEGSGEPASLLVKIFGDGGQKLTESTSISRAASTCSSTPSSAPTASKR